MNAELKKTIKSLRTASRVGGGEIWAALADELDGSKRRRSAVNLSRIDRHTETGGVVAIPGKVLASGSLTHPVTVAAFSFSEGARVKIALAEGRAISLDTLLDEGFKPSTIKIMK